METEDPKNNSELKAHPLKGLLTFLLFLSICVSLAIFAHYSIEKHRTEREKAYDINKCSPLVKCIGDDIILNKNEWKGNIHPLDKISEHYLLEFKISRDTGALEVSIDNRDIEDKTNVSLRIKTLWYPDSLGKVQIKEHNAYIEKMREHGIYDKRFLVTTKDNFEDEYIDENRPVEVCDDIILNKDEKNYIVYLGSIIRKRFEERNIKQMEADRRQNSVKDSILSVEMRNLFFENCK